MVSLSTGEQYSFSFSSHHLILAWSNYCWFDLKYRYYDLKIKYEKAVCFADSLICENLVITCHFAIDSKQTINESSNWLIDLQGANFSNSIQQKITKLEPMNLPRHHPSLFQIPDWNIVSLFCEIFYHKSFLLKSNFLPYCREQFKFQYVANKTCHGKVHWNKFSKWIYFQNGLSLWELQQIRDIFQVR